MSQAQQQYGGQKQYMYNASMTLKNQGNDEIKAPAAAPEIPYLLWVKGWEGGVTRQWRFGKVLTLRITGNPAKSRGLDVYN